MLSNALQHLYDTCDVATKYNTLIGKTLDTAFVEEIIEE